MLDFLINVFTENGIMVDLILILTGVYIYLDIVEYNRKLEELKGGKNHED